MKPLDQVIAASSGKGALPPALRIESLTPESISQQGIALERLGAGISCREQVAGGIAKHLFDTFREVQTGQPAFALVRCFQTVTLEKLPPERRVFATRRLGGLAPRGDIRCLALLATCGIEAGWNSVAQSAEHQAIPLPTVEVILRTPMIARLLLEVGVRFEQVVAPPPPTAAFLLDAPPGASNVFHVEKALGSPFIPAQATFVHRCGIRSVLGMGGLLPSGEFFATILFSRVTIPRRTAEMFAPLAQSMRNSLAPCSPDQVFLDKSR